MTLETVLATMACHYQAVQKEINLNRRSMLRANFLGSDFSKDDLRKL